jgi:hypothetical protein
MPEENVEFDQQINEENKLVLRFRVGMWHFAELRVLLNTK